jgi:branched-chain amino acid transport system ATP-binding protein
MAEPLLLVEDLVKRFGGLVATNGVTLDVKPGEAHALIGPNGAGKTTLIAQLQGELRPTSGRIFFDGRDITHLRAPTRARAGIARSFQISSIFPEFSALANVVLAVQARESHSFRFLRRALSDERLIAPARDALAMIGLSERSETKAAELSHGERRQLELAMAVAMRPKLLLLDEPLAGMGRQDSIRMTQIICSLKAHHAMLIVEHDMDAVFAIADRISVLVYGAVIASGTPEAIRREPKVRESYLGTTKEVV